MTTEQQQQQQHQHQVGLTLPPLRQHQQSTANHHHPLQQQQQQRYRPVSPNNNSSSNHSSPTSNSLNQHHHHYHQQQHHYQNKEQSHILKRTASRAELDRRPKDQFVHSQPPPPLPTRETTSSSRQANHQDERPFVKPEYLTPHLPPQSLPTESNHTSPQLRSNSSSSELSPDPRNGNQPIHQQEPRKTIRRSDSIKKRRMSIADEGSLIKTRQNAHHTTNSPQNQNQPTESQPEPISPLVIGFNQPHDPHAIQQVANTIKLRDEQKRLIEQRRNSFAGLNSFSFSSNNTRIHPPPSHINTTTHRYSPGNPPTPRTSISKPGSSSSANNNHNDSIHTGHNGLMKLLSHPSLPISTPSSSNQSSYELPPPVVSLPSIDEAAPHKPHPNRPPQKQPTSINTHQDTHPDLTPSPDMLDLSSPTQSTQIGFGSSVADRRGQLVREKVKNMALAPQAFRPQLLTQSSVKSAPIRSGFLQATAPNGEVVKTPLIARTNLGGTGNGNQTPDQSQQSRFTKFNPNHSSSSLNHSSRLHQSIGSGPSTAYPNLGASEGPYRQGIERRMTMHGGSLMQVPTLSHLMSASNNPLSQSQSSPGRGRPAGKSISHHTQSIPLIPGPSPAHYPHNHHHYQQHHQHSVTGTPSQATFQDHSQPPNSARLLRTSISGPPPPPPPPPGIPSKQMFLQLFESFYDSLSDSKVLQNNLEEQIRRSAQLLHSLQQSAGIFENILDDRLAQVQTQSTRELQILENRLDSLEARLPPPPPTTTTNTATTNSTPATNSTSNGARDVHRPRSLEEVPEEVDLKFTLSNGSPQIALSTDSGNTSSSLTDTVGGPRSGTGIDEGHRSG
ncbi:hypothetical protein MJO28_008464 [Puccinia striiformis f. sp. tritici]|uniref:Uncharacterized protein n=3 Tax=Puccinia striiformis TaxID=27350 RepID=A0A2S4VCY1_9BASI|nr:hypothetical protein Pst134EB_016587 [Puccinia striiformis f. sp. tritici]KAI7949643.1 hypothetical protein MJO28_008464 [Puccinia striiformis f. sp. tritici]POW07371.1 hypothetical protein PSTT_08333 [Puccinia striiformis]POW21197.1 hypothetical protein PSHT_02666 [Puccinia striiformis]